MRNSNVRLSLLFTLAALLFGGAAFAQNQPPPEGEEPGTLPDGTTQTVTDEAGLA